MAQYKDRWSMEKNLNLIPSFALYGGERQDRCII